MTSPRSSALLRRTYRDKAAAALSAYEKACKFRNEVIKHVPLHGTWQKATEVSLVAGRLYYVYRARGADPTDPVGEPTLLRWTGGGWVEVPDVCYRENPLPGTGGGLMIFTQAPR